MSSQLYDYLVASIGTFAWTLLWQSTLWLGLGLLVGQIWRGRAARAHLLLVLATVAALACPLLTAGVRGLGWGVLPSPSPELAQAVPDNTPPISTGSSAISAAEHAESPIVQEAAADFDMPANAHIAENSPPTAVVETVHETNVPAQATRPSTSLSGIVSLPGVTIGAWIVCSLALFIRLMSSLFAGRRLARQSTREADARLLAALCEARGLLAVRSGVDLRTSPGARCPMIWCWATQPILLVPPSAGEQRGISWCGIFCHELAHWLRRDHLPALWADFLVILLPWQPLALLSRRRLSSLREQACDDWVLASRQEATDYAESLVNLVPQSAPTFALPALRSYESLKLRLEHVLAGVRVTPRAGRNWIALASLVSLAAAAGIAFAQQRNQTTNAKADAQTSPASTTSADQSNDMKLLPAREENGDDFTVRGRVLKPDGTTAAGARLSIVRYFFGYLGLRANSALVTTGTADADGRFALTYHPSQIVAGVGRVAQWRETTVLAQADGFGLQWANWQDINPDKPLVLKLAVDAPIRGRVIDLEGRPVEGAAVSISGVDGAENGRIDPWLDAVKSGADAPAAWRAANLKSLPYYEDGSKPPVKTGRDGRFVLSGVGPDRIVGLAVTGETITRTTITVVTRAMPPITRQLNVGFSPMKDVVFGNDFTFQPRPSRPITGTVRDAATGKPLAGVTVASDIFAGTRLAGIRDVMSQTDGQGHYRLVGMPKGKGNEIMAFPNDDQPYLMRSMVVPDAPGAGPVTVDIELHRGIWIEGRAFDKATGKPAIARLHYWPFRNNPFTRGLPEFKDLNVDGDQFRYATRPDGTFRLVGLPGHAIVGAEAVAASYKQGVGADKIKGAEKNGYFPTYFNPIVPTLKWPSALKEINPSKDATTVHCDFALERGETIRVTLVDRESKPVAGCTVEGRATGNYAPVPQATFDLENLSLNETRPILIEHKERGIGKFLLLKFDEKTPRTMSITLEPSATLVGRVLDEDGVPLGGTHLHASPRPGGDFWPRLPSVVCKPDGTFKYSGLVPGCDYYLQAEGTQMEVRVVSKQLKIEPGELIDLGDIKFKRNSDEVITTEPRRQAASPKTATASVVGDLMTVRGQVLKPDGLPAAGARVSMRRQYWTRSVKWRPMAIATADATGRFELSCRPSQFIDDFGSRLRYATIAAQADGFGVQWTDLQMLDPLKPLILRLVPEFPIQGRIVDLEGKPVEGVRVRLNQIRAPKSGENLAPWLEAVKLGAMTNGLSAKLGSILPGIEDDSESPVLTDRDGRFTFRGIGAERDVRLELRGDAVASRQFDVATREMKPLKRQIWFSSTDQIFGASFTMQAAPTKPIVGTVRDRATGKPLRGVRVESENLAGLSFYPRDGLQTRTDADGNFRLVGMPKQTSDSADRILRNEIGIIPDEDQPYFIRKIIVPDTPGLEPVTLDVDLRRGQWVTGRVTDKTTGKPVISKVEYFPYVKNSFATLPDFDRDQADLSRDERFHTRPDGTYRLLALPGRAIVGVTAVSGLYRTGVGASAIADVDQGVGLQKYMNNPNPRFLSALKEIDPAQGAEMANCDFVVDPGETVHIRLVDREGRGVSGASLTGEGGTAEGWIKVSTGPTFDVINLAPREKRTIEIYHRERQIGKHLVLNFDEKSPRTMTVTLEPCATLVGRLVDSDGVPVRGLEIHASPSPGSWPWPFTPIETSRTDGRFDCRGLYPGCTYDLAVALARGNTIDVQFLRRGLEIEPGKVINLGDVKLNRDSIETAENEPQRVKAAKATMPSDPATGRTNGAPSLSGRVLDKAGRPLAGAHLAAIAWRKAASRGGDLDARYEVLCETNADTVGRFQVHIAGASPETHEQPLLMARAEGYGLAATPFNLAGEPASVTLSLLREHVVRARLVDLQGQPAAGVEAQVVQLSEGAPKWIPQYGWQLPPGMKYPAVWPRATVSDAQGHIEIHGLPPATTANLEIPPSDRFARQDLTVHPGPLVKSTSSKPRSGAYQIPAAGDESVVPLAAAQTIEGVVRYADTKRPVPHSRLTAGASQQPFPFGSFVAIPAQADAQGRFRIRPYPGVSFKVAAYAPLAEPYLTREKMFDWKAGTSTAHVDIELPRGVLVHGRVVEARTGTPIEHASIQYLPDDKTRTKIGDEVITGWQATEKTDSSGGFALAVPRGSGHLLVYGPTGEFVSHVIGDRDLGGRGRGGQRWYAHAILPVKTAAGISLPDVTISLQRGVTLSGRLVPPDGAEPKATLLVGRLVNVSSLSPMWRANPEIIRGPQFLLSGWSRDEEISAYFLDPDRHLGATLRLHGVNPPSPLTVRLEPCGTAKARFVDGQGKPIADFSPAMQMVVTPGPDSRNFQSLPDGAFLADADFVANIDRKNYWNSPKTDDSGWVTFPVLIPGADYRIVDRLKESVVQRDFKVQAGQTLDLGDVVIDRPRGL